MKMNCKQTLVTVAILSALMLGNTGCQTFNLTQEEFERQQRGEAVDCEVGTAVGVVGSLGYLGALLGLAGARGAGVKP